MAAGSVIDWGNISTGGAGRGGGNPGSNQYMTNTPYMPTPQNTAGGSSSISSPGSFGWDFSFNPSATPTAPGGANVPGGFANNNIPGVVPPNAGGGGGSGSLLTLTGPGGASGMTGIGKGMYAQNPIDPALTSQLFQWLQGQVGQGVSPFNLSTLLPSSGQATQAGQLNAPLNSVLQNLMQIFNPQSGSLGQLASGGIDATPVWQKTVDALQRQRDQGANNLREQFAFSGNLDSSPFGQSMVDYQTQTNKDDASLLANMQFQGIQDQLAASGQQQGFGQFLQGLDQQSIQNMLQEFIRTSPQYNPTLGMQFGAATTFPPVLQPQHGGGALGGLLGSLGSLLHLPLLGGI